MEVIIADSSGLVRSVLASLLRTEGYVVSGEAADGKALLALVAKACPDIVCLDRELANGDWAALMQALHEKDEGQRHISVVVMAAAGTDELRAQVAAAGAAGFLGKPFKPAQVSAELRQVAHARALLARLGRPPAAPAGARHRAIIADDSATQRQLLRTILEACGCQVVGEADNGAAAVELVAEHAADLLCLDVEMPVMNGLDALAKIHASHPQLPVMMITSHTERDLVKDAAARGARGYILKPYHPEKVREAISRLLAATP